MSKRSVGGASALAVLSIVLTSCGSVGLGDGPEAELERNRERWVRVGPSSYVYDVQRNCFCAEPARGPVRVTVENGAVVARAYVATSDPVPQGLEELFPAVGGLFDVLEDAFQRDAFRVDVTYDPQLGVPIDFFIDYQENVADEELGFQVTQPAAPAPR